MPIVTIIWGVLAILIVWVLSHPKIRNKPVWRATVTPLASIIGSGFLIAAPLLNDLSGHYAIYVMVTLCVFAYSIGQIIRWNIQHVEPNLAAQQDRHILQIERLSDIALTAAYVLSVTYYLYLFFIIYCQNFFHSVFRNNTDHHDSGSTVNGILWLFPRI